MTLARKHTCSGKRAHKLCTSVSLQRSLSSLAGKLKTSIHVKCSGLTSC